MPSIKKVVIGIPTEGHTLPEAYDNHLLFSLRLGALEQRLKNENAEVQYETYWHTVGRLLTPFAREQLVNRALETNVDFIMMFDDDMVLPPDMFERMMKDMIDHPEIDILGALAFMRNPPHFAVIYSTETGFDTHRNQPYYINTSVKNYPKDTLIECDAVGFGAVVIRVDLIKKMREPYFMSTTATGEDILFCVNAKKVGGRVFVDTGIKTGHIGKPVIITEDYFEKYIKDSGTPMPEVPYEYNNDR